MGTAGCVLGNSQTILLQLAERQLLGIVWELVEYSSPGGKFSGFFFQFPTHPLYIPLPDCFMGDFRIAHITMRVVISRALSG